MSREPTGQPTRRDVLALAGSAAFAGCSGFPGDLFGGEQPTRIDGSKLREVLGRDAPTVPETVPVDVEQSYLDRTAGRAREHLSAMPSSLGPDDVPNEAIRRELQRARQQALEALDAASQATPYEALADLRDARAQARFAAAGWRAIVAGVTRADVASRASTVLSDARAFRDRWRYVGEDPVRAVLVHRVVESRVGGAERLATLDDDPREGRQENPITVAELAERLERARASLDDAAYLYDRFVGSLDESRDLRSTFEAARGTLFTEIEERRRGLPADSVSPSEFVDRDIGGTPAASALEELRWGASSDRLSEARSDGNLATSVVATHETLAHLRAFSSLRDRVADGERFAVESAADVAALRADAVDAVEAALADAEHPRLTREEVGDVVGSIRYADENLKRYLDDGDEVRANWLDAELGRYVQAAAVARAVPPASDQTANALRDA